MTALWGKGIMNSQNVTANNESQFQRSMQLRHLIMLSLGGVIGSWAIGAFFMMPYMVPAQISSVEEKLLKKNIITEKQNQTSFGYRMDGAGFDKTYKVNPCVKMVPNILAIASAVIPFNYPPQRCYSLQKSNPERSFSAF